MGRGPFFGSSRKMRGFPMNLSPGGLDPDGPPGFPYFATADGKFEFGGYGPGPFHPHDGPFFPGHPGHPGGPGGQPLPFSQPGKDQWIEERWHSFRNSPQIHSAAHNHILLH